MAAVGLNFLTGSTGQISLGQGASFGIGAYTTAILVSKLELSFFLAIPAAGTLTVLFAIGFCIPAARLRFIYLAFITLAGQLIFDHLIKWMPLTGGQEGLIINESSFLGLDLNDDRIVYYIVFLCLVAFTWMAVNLTRTSYGRAFSALRINPRATEALGISVVKFRMLSIAMSSFYTGLAGGLFTLHMLAITPELFNLWLSIEFIAMIIIGGLGSISGSIMGACFIVILNEFLIFLTDIATKNDLLIDPALTNLALREFSLGIIIVLFILFQPKGLYGIWHNIILYFRRWPFS